MKYILLIFSLIFGGCSLKHYEQTQTKIIIIKSPKIKFADVGYIRNSDKQIELELFVAGHSIQKISINHLICVSDGCMSKSGFNSDYLNDSYPDDILQNILLAHPIYGGEDLNKTEDGFKQYIENEHVQIEYKVSSHATIFKDKQNGILFKIKDMQERKSIE
jgi:hypothetical protein